MSDSNLTLPTRSERQARLEELVVDLMSYPHLSMRISPAERRLLIEVLRAHVVLEK